MWTYTEINPNDPRLVFSGEEPTNSLVESIRNYGLMYRPKLRESRGKLEILAGNRRIKAAKKAGLTTIPVGITTIDRKDSLILALADHGTRHENPVADYERILDLESMGVEDSEISTLTGMPIGTIKKRRELGNLNPILLEGLSSGKIKTTTAEAAAKLDEDRQEELARIFIANDKLKLREVLQTKKINRDDNLEDAFSFLDEIPWEDEIITHLQISRSLVQEDPKLTKMLDLVINYVEKLNGL